MEILNLDDIIKEDREVKFNGKTFTVPGDIPVRLSLRLVKLSQEMQKDAHDEAIIERACDIFTEIFRQKEKDFDKSVLNSLSMKQYHALMTFMFGVKPEDIKFDFVQEQPDASKKKE